MQDSKGSQPRDSSTIGTPRRAFTRTGAASALRAQWIRQTTPPPGEDDIATALARTATTHEHDVWDVWIYGLYLTILGRLPDASGHYAQRGLFELGTPPELVADGIARGAEGAGRHGTVPSPLAVAFVTGAFLLSLGRLPDEEMLTYVEDYRSHGVPELTLARIRTHIAGGSTKPVTSEPLARCLAVAYQQLVLGITPRPDLTERLWIAHAHNGHVGCFTRAVRDSGQFNRRTVLRAQLAALTGRLREVELTARIRHLELQVAAGLDRERLNRPTPAVYGLVAPLSTRSGT